MLTAVLVFLLQVQARTPDAQQGLAAARCVEVSHSPDERVARPEGIAPGAPPVLSFRYYEGQLHRRYSNSDLMLDDAGH